MSRINEAFTLHGIIQIFLVVGDTRVDTPCCSGLEIRTKANSRAFDKGRFKRRKRDTGQYRSNASNRKL
jgi:hypothetical protein